MTKTNSWLTIRNRNLQALLISYKSKYWLLRAAPHPIGCRYRMGWMYDIWNDSKAVTDKGQIFVFWPSAIDPKRSFEHGFRLPDTGHWQRATQTRFQNGSIPIESWQSNLANQMALPAKTSRSGYNKLNWKAYYQKFINFFIGLYAIFTWQNLQSPSFESFMN